MTLYLIGLGLSDEKDITIKGLEAIKKSQHIYLEDYTSLMNCSKEDLEKFYGKKIILADRELTEQKSQEILEKAKKEDVAFLVIGDSLCATTHVDLIQRAKENKVKTEIIHNTSIITAIGITGLQIYKFGKITSIPFPQKDYLPETPYTVLKENQSINAHTLFLLDLDPKNNKFMTIKEAIEFLITIEKKRKEQIINENTLSVGCSRIGMKDQKIKFGKIKELIKEDFGKPPYCIIIPAKLHFMEEESLKHTIA